MISHFWFSRKQFDLKDSGYQTMPPTEHLINYCIIDGIELIYSMTSVDKQHSAIFDDMRYLGTGVYSRSIHYYGMPSYVAESFRRII